MSGDEEINSIMASFMSEELQQNLKAAITRKSETLRTTEGAIASLRERSELIERATADNEPLEKLLENTRYTSDSLARCMKINRTSNEKLENALEGYLKVNKELLNVATSKHPSQSSLSSSDCRIIDHDFSAGVQKVCDVSLKLIADLKDNYETSQAMNAILRHKVSNSDMIKSALEAATERQRKMTEEERKYCHLEASDRIDSALRENSSCIESLIAHKEHNLETISKIEQCLEENKNSSKTFHRLLQVNQATLSKDDVTGDLKLDGETPSPGPSEISEVNVESTAV